MLDIRTIHWLSILVWVNVLGTDIDVQGMNFQDDLVTNFEILHLERVECVLTRCIFKLI